MCSGDQVIRVQPPGDAELLHVLGEPRVLCDRQARPLSPAPASQPPAPGSGVSRIADSASLTSGHCLHLP